MRQANSPFNRFPLRCNIWQSMTPNTTAPAFVFSTMHSKPTKDSAGRIQFKDISCGEKCLVKLGGRPVLVEKTDLNRVARCDSPEVSYFLPPSEWVVPEEG